MNQTCVGFVLGALAATVIAGAAISAAPKDIKIQTGDVKRLFFFYLPGPPAPPSAGPFPFPVVDIVPQGYVTFGSDSGHVSGESLATMAAFTLNQEALENFGGAQLKKVHEVAARIIKRYFGRAPLRMYFYGSSQGGHEALTVIQRWHLDYDGVVSIHPA